MRILAVSTHPDDETLGAGGTLLKHRQQDDELHWFIATAACAPRYSAAHIQRQREYVQRLIDLYGFASVHWPRLPTTRLDHLPLGEVIDPLRDTLLEVKPHWIYTVGNYDVHTDHQIVFSALLTTVKSFNRGADLRRIMSYEVISSTDVYPMARSQVFVPNVYSDITPFIEQKIEIMTVLEEETQPSPLPRSPESIRSLARYRGSIIGVPYAEAFMLIFEAF